MNLARVIHPEATVSWQGRSGHLWFLFPGFEDQRRPRLAGWVAWVPRARVLLSGSQGRLGAGQGACDRALIRSQTITITAGPGPELGLSGIHDGLCRCPASGQASADGEAGRPGWGELRLNEQAHRIGRLDTQLFPEQPTASLELAMRLRPVSFGQMHLDESAVGTLPERLQVNCGQRGLDSIGMTADRAEPAGQFSSACNRIWRSPSRSSCTQSSYQSGSRSPARSATPTESRSAILSGNFTSASRPANATRSWTSTLWSASRLSRDGWPGPAAHRTD